MSSMCLFSMVCCFRPACTHFCTTHIKVVLRLQCACIDPDNQGPTGPKCGMPDYKGDGNCDDENNNAACAYDGGDCCPKTVSSGNVSKKYCTKVGRD